MISENYRKSIRSQHEIARKAITFDKKSIAFDTKPNETYKKSTRIHQNIAMKSIAFDKKSVASEIE